MVSLQNKQITEHYISLKNLDPGLQKEIFKALEWVQGCVASDVFNLSLISSGLGEEENSPRGLLFEFLDQFFAKGKSSVFLADHAQAHKTKIFDASTYYTENVHIYHSPQKLGIQEKYIRGILTKQHWLTDLDIHRCLKSYAIHEKVKISLLSVPDLSATLALALQEHTDANQEYTIPLLLNSGVQDSGPGDHWLFAEVTVNPISKTIKYRIEDDIKLDKGLITQYEAKVKEAVAHLELTLDSENSSITAHSEQTDAFASGYWAMRRLVQSLAVAPGATISEKVAEFSRVELNSESLITHFYRDQLTDLRVPTEIFSCLSAIGQSQFDESFGTESKVKTVDLNKLNSFLAGSEQLKKPQASSTHNKITDVIGSFTPTLEIIRFPNGALDASLGAVEYERFLSQLHEIEDIAKSQCKELSLPFVTSDALDGINSYFALNRSVAVKRVTLAISVDSLADKVSFISKLKLTLSSLSKAGLDSISLIDEANYLTETDLNELKQLATLVQLTCELKLPPNYATLSLQRELDHVIEQNQLKKNMRMLSATSTPIAEKVITVKEKRQRTTIDFTKANKQVDVEIQASIEAVEQFETVFLQEEQDVVFARDQEFSISNLRTDFLYDRYESLASLNLIIKKKDFVSQWNQLLGKIDTIDETSTWSSYPFSISHISNKAIEQLFKNGQIPAGGIDFEQLPQGFFYLDDIKSGPGNEGAPPLRALHYNPNYVPQQQTIAPVTADNLDLRLISTDIAAGLIELLKKDVPDDVLVTIWHSLNTQEPYDAKAHQQFRQILPELLCMDAAIRTSLISACNGSTQLNWARLHAFFKHQGQLARLYNEQSEPFKAEDVLNTKAFNQLLGFIPGPNPVSTDLGLESLSTELPSEPEEYAKQLVVCAASVNKLAPNNHPIFTLLASQPDLKTKLAEATATYGLRLTQLNELLRIYSSHGGLEISKVLLAWDEISQLSHIKSIAVEIISNSNPYQDILKTNDLLDYCRELNNDGSDKRQWFLTLYARHAPKSKNDFVALGKSFKQFTQRIEQKGFNFYSLDKIANPFTPKEDMKLDMQTAMRRIETLLDGCRADDTGPQWDNIAALDLRSNAAVRAVNPDRDGRRCHFVIPQMGINPDANLLHKAYCYDTNQYVGRISSDLSESAVQRAFFRYISYQEHRMPLSFYLDAVAKIEAMSGTIKRTELNTLYRILADITTGKNYELFIANESEAMERWKKITDLIFNAQIKKDKLPFILQYLPLNLINRKIHETIISGLGEITPAPNIEVLEKLVTSITADIYLFIKKATWTNADAAESAASRLQALNELLVEMVTLFGNLVFIGMKDYANDDYEKIYPTPKDIDNKYKDLGSELSVFAHHGFIVAKIAEKQEPIFGSLIVPLISTFSLSRDDIDQLYKQYELANTPVKSLLLTFFGKVLLETIGTVFKADDLNALMNEMLEENGLFDQIQKSLLHSSTSPAELSVDGENPAAVEGDPPLFSDEYQKLLRYFSEGNSLTVEEENTHKSLYLLSSYLISPQLLTDLSERTLPIIHLTNLTRAKLADFIANNQRLDPTLRAEYADRLRNPKKSATNRVKLFIDKKIKNEDFKKAFEAIRSQFSELPEEGQFQLVKDFVTVLNACVTDAEKSELISTLGNPKLMNQGAEPYLNLLSAIKKSGSSLFVYSMREADTFVEKNKLPIIGLCQKIVYLIGEAIPELANQFNRLNVVEFAPLITTLIYVSQPEDLLNTQLLVTDSSAKWDKLAQDLSSARNEQQLNSQIEEIRDVLSQLNFSGDKAREDKDLLTEHLQKLENPITKQVVLEDEKVEISASDMLDDYQDGLAHYTFSKESVSEPQKLASRFSLQRFTSLFLIPKPVEKYYKTTTTYIEKKEPDVLNGVLVNTVLAHIEQEQNTALTYRHALVESIRIIDNLIMRYPAAKAMLLPLCRNYLEFNDGVSEEVHIKQAYNNLQRFSQELTALDNQDMVISLCEHFSNKQKFKFTDLLNILKGGEVKVSEQLTLGFSGYSLLKLEARQQLFTMMTVLLNNKKTFSLNDLARFIARLRSDDYLNVIKAVYEKAPYPELSQVNQWFDKSKSNESDVYQQVIQQYTEWNIEPVSREDGLDSNDDAVNGFNLKRAEEQGKEIAGIAFTDLELQNIEILTDDVKKQSTAAILEELQKIRNDPDLASAHQKDPAKLLALVAELLYRTKGLPAETVDGQRKWGNSFEINTTQYLAIYSLLKSEKPTIAGIGTGEGKTRIMMISIAAQWALGRTVDFVTADVSLATRDYLEYQAFFKSFGAQTSLISAESPIDQYCLDGINFSDATNLSLFRNKARSQGLSDKVIHPDKKKRCLKIDEADQTLFDATDTRYNFSAKADLSIQDMGWIYECLVEFFLDKNNEALFHGPESDADACNAAFKQFVTGRLNLTIEQDKEKLKKLERISRTQLESWQTAALTALNLKYGDDFTIEARVPIVTKKGPSYVSQASLIAGGVAANHAKFSIGVHQCLHARLNLERSLLQTGTLPQNPLQNELNTEQFDAEFPVDSEHQIIYSSTSKALTDDYEYILGVSGTPGSWTERAEKADFAFIDIPRHKGLNRKDKPHQLSKNLICQHENILAEVKASLANRQPILLICKDDIESKEINDYLLKQLSPDEQKQLKRVTANTSIDEEAAIVSKDAGRVGAITISTLRMGRGTDIKLHGEAEENGLHVIGTYLPTTRNYLQIIGRAARFGAKGSSRLILNEESMREQFQAASKLPHDFYAATESYLEHLQERMESQAQKERIIKEAVGDFRMNLTTAFFERFFKPIAASEDTTHDLVKDKWRKFFDASDKVWNELWPKISEALAEKDIEQVARLLVGYQAEVQGFWKGMHEELAALANLPDVLDLNKLPVNIDNIKLTRGGIELLHYDVGTHVVFATPIADKYDPAYDGRAVIYKGFWENLRRNVFPSLFSLGDSPYVLARKNGNMTLSQFFLGGDFGIPLKTDDSKFQSKWSDQQRVEPVELKSDSTAKIFNLGLQPGVDKSKRVNETESTKTSPDNSVYSISNKAVESDDTYLVEKVPP